MHKTPHNGLGTVARTDDGTTHVGVKGGRSIMTTASSGIVAGVPSANVAMAMMDGIMIGGESEAVAQIAIVTVAGTGVGIVIAGTIETVGVEFRNPYRSMCHEALVFCSRPCDAIPVFGMRV